MVDANTIDALLPQTQCEECGFPGCLPYAQALARGQAPIDRCPPGGIATVKALGELLGIDPSPYLASVEKNTREPAIAVIREAECIGCTKCIEACPVDAIVGSAKFMHSILTHECTGCGLCVEPCPVDCIEIQPTHQPLYDKDLARQRFQARHIRRLREEQDRVEAYREKRRLSAQSTEQIEDKNAKQAYILQALARQKVKRAHDE